MEKVLEKLELVLAELTLIKQKLGIYQSADQDQDLDLDQDLDPDLIRKELIDQDLDPDLYDLDQADRSIRYYFKHRARINSKKQYLLKSLAKFMRSDRLAVEGKLYRTQGFTDDELDQYLGFYSEDLRRSVEDRFPDLRERYKDYQQLAFVADRRVIIAYAKKEGLL